MSHEVAALGRAVEGKRRKGWGGMPGDREMLMLGPHSAFVN